ncbi:TPA: hypothetical protein LU109_003587 [Enterobacter hormaechei subsp. xiangfangensis]|nr:hypothetical protein [Enterobacter hormaechei subsp. xiangfangensis]
MTIIETKTVKPVNNIFAILLVVLPALTNLVEYFARLPENMVGGLTLISIIAVTVLVCLDAKELEKAGYDAPSRWWVIIVPVYIWKRDGKVGTKYRMFFVIWMLIYAVAVWGYLHAFHQRDMAEKACTTVTTLMHDNFQVDRTCQGVINVENIGGNKYRALAVLDGGDTVNITIEDRGDTYYTELRYPSFN